MGGSHERGPETPTGRVIKVEEGPERTRAGILLGWAHLYKAVLKFVTEKQLKRPPESSTL